MWPSHVHTTTRTHVLSPLPTHARQHSRAYMAALTCVCSDKRSGAPSTADMASPHPQHPHTVVGLLSCANTVFLSSCFGLRADGPQGAPHSGDRWECHVLQSMKRKSLWPPMLAKLSTLQGAQAMDEQTVHNLVSCPSTPPFSL